MSRRCTKNSMTLQLSTWCACASHNLTRVSCEKYGLVFSLWVNVTVWFEGIQFVFLYFFNASQLQHLHFFFAEHDLPSVLLLFCCSFVTMDNVKGAQRAIEYLDGFTIKDQVLSVQVKLSKEELARKRERYTVSASRRLPLFFIRSLIHFQSLAVFLLTGHVT